MENEEELKKEVVELFNKLEEERNVTYDFTLGIPRDPDPRKFVEIFNKMFAKCEELQKLDLDKYDLNKLNLVQGKELLFVKRFSYYYKSGVKTEESKEELKALMADVINHVERAIPTILQLV